MFFSLTFIRTSRSLKSRQCKARHKIYKYQFIEWRLRIVLRETLYVCPRLNLGALICLGLKQKKNDQDEHVYQVLCKICAANKDKIYCHQAVKGATKTAAECFINGTNFVTKHSVS